VSAEALAVLREVGDRYMIASALLRVGRAAMTVGNVVGARAAFDEGLALSRALQAPTDTTRQLSHLGQLAAWEGDAARARPLSEASLALARENGDVLGIAIGVFDVGRAAMVAGDMVEAYTLILESLPLLEQAGLKRGVGMALHALAQAAWGLGNKAEATARWQECLALQREMGDRIGIAQCLEGLATVGLDQPAQATRFLAVAAELREATGAPVPLADRPVHTATLVTARTAMGEESYERIWVESQRLPLDTIIRDALAG
jgi:tetratricopeptide (TPR) repeat protein